MNTEQTHTITAYIISGLGADQRAFQKTELPPNIKIRHLEWITPKADEHLTDYCLRLAEPVNTKEPFILIGLSFGGIAVTELAKKLNPLKSIIISSASLSSQLPWYFKLVGRLKIHRLIPTSLLKSANPISFWFFDSRTAEEKKLLTEILHDTDSPYLRWAVNAVLTWKNNERPEKLFHIQGTSDRILPARYMKPDVIIEGGRHFMVLSKAAEVNRILKEQLSGI